MSDLFSFALLAFTSFLTLINPLSVMPLFMTLTKNLSEEAMRATAKKAMIVAFVALVLFGISGQLIFQFFSITVDSLKVVGGIIFFMIGQDMLQARIVTKKKEEIVEESYVRDISITPLAIPMICGPGSITNAIVLMEGPFNILHALVLAIVIGIVLFITYQVFIHSSKITRFLGESGSLILMRIMGLIVMVIAVEFFFAGITPFLQNIFHII